MATTDVAQKITVDDRQEGTMVVFVTMLGVIYKNQESNTTNPTTVEAMETKLTDKFDDPTYYTA